MLMLMLGGGWCLGLKRGERADGEIENEEREENRNK